jgi:hypothetical protein
MRLSAILRYVFCFIVISAIWPAQAQLVQEVPQETEADRLPPEEKAKASAKSSGLAEKVYSTLAELSLSLSAKQSLKILNGLKITGRYKIEVAPSYLGHYYSRRDIYNPSLVVNVADFISAHGLIFRMEPGILFDFIQFYPEYKQALKPTNGYFINKFPFTAEEAINDLKPGDYAIMSAYLNVGIGYGENWSPLDAVGVVAAGARNTGRSLKIYVFKAEDNKIRIRMMANRNKALTFNGNIGWTPHIIGVDVINKFLNRITNITKIFESRYDFNDSSALFVGDFTLNLNKDNAVDAYNSMFTKERYLAVLKAIFDPFASNEKIHDEMVQLIEPLNIIYRDDAKKIGDHSLRTVDRNFEGSTFSAGGLPYKVEAGISGIWRGEKKGSHPHIGVTRLNQDDTREKFSVSTATTELQFSAGVSRFKEKTRINRILINQTDDKWVPTKLRGLGFYIDYTDKRFYDGEGEDFIEKLQKLLPASVVDDLIKKMIAENWYTFNEMRSNVRIGGRLFLKDAAMVKYFNTPEATIKEKLIAHLEALHKKGIKLHLKRMVKDISGRCGALPSHNPKNTFQNLTHKDDVKSYYCRDIAWIAKYLSKVLYNDLTVLDAKSITTNRERYFNELGKSGLFADIGLAFMLNDMTLADLADSVYLDIKIFSNLSDIPFLYEHGTLADLELYDSIVDVMNFMTDQNPDMRLIGTTDSITTRRSND